MNYSTKVITEKAPTEYEYPLSDLPCGETGILTRVPNDHALVTAGDPVIGGSLGGELVFPRTKQYTDRVGAVVAGYRWRKLRKGERVIIEGE
jgi:hypothetical protein